MKDAHTELGGVLLGIGTYSAYAAMRGDYGQDARDAFMFGPRRIAKEINFFNAHVPRGTVPAGARVRLVRKRCRYVDTCAYQVPESKK